MTAKKPQQTKGVSKKTGPTPIKRERTQPSKKAATSFIISSGGKKKGTSGTGPKGKHD